MKHFKYIVLITTLITLSSCTDWLQVEPKDKIMEETLYKTESGTNSILAGFYKNLATEELYGGSMTTKIVDVLGQYYFTGYASMAEANNSMNSVYYFANYKYGGTAAMNELGAMWEASYQTIFGINNFIANVEKKDAVSAENKKLLLGEAYALRALLHTDLFRLFGPIYSLDPEAESISYNQSASLTVSTKLKASEFIDLVLADIEKASVLLEKDPIIEKGALDTDLPVGQDKFYFFRNKRMNYYAVQALKARVLLYKGGASDIQAAGVVAKNVLDALKAKNFFPLDAITANNFIAYKEVLFGLDNGSLNTIWEELTVGTQNNYLYTVKDVILKKEIFNMPDQSAALSSFEDKRVLQWRVGFGNGPADEYVSRKYFLNAVLSADSPIRQFQPLLRVSELYYILAEAKSEAGDYAGAATTINEILAARGRGITLQVDVNSSTKEIIDAELKREYYREFYGEGQAFFYQKRRNEPTIMNGLGNSNPIPMTPTKYLVTTPLSETNIN